MDADWGNNDFNLGGIEISLVEDVGDEFFDRLKGTVTFPVSADDHFSLRSFTLLLDIILNSHLISNN